MSHGIKFRGEHAFITDCLHCKPPILESAFPLHEAHEQEKIWKKMKQNVILCPLEEIRDYYGTAKINIISHCHKLLHCHLMFPNLLVQLYCMLIIVSF